MNNIRNNPLAQMVARFSAFLVMVAAFVGCMPVMQDNTSITFQAGTSTLVNPRIFAIEPNRDPIATPLGDFFRLQGFRVMNTDDTWGLMQNLRINGGKLYDRESLDRLRSRSVDAIITARSLTAPDGKPIGIVIRVVSTANGQVVGQWSWSNPERVSVSKAASDLSAEVAARIRSY